MKILQIGVPKSGNFWLYNILQQVLHRSGHSRGNFIQQHPIHSIAKTWDLNYPTQADIDMINITDLQTVYRISSIFKMPLDNPDDYFSKTDHVWTHSPICKKSKEIFSFFKKKVYIIRDPRDVVISASKYYCSDYMLKYFPQHHTDPDKFLEQNIEKLLHDWVWHVWDHLRLRKTFDLHIAFFEGFRNSFQEEFSLLLDYLDVDLDSRNKEAIEEAVSFSTLKKENPKHLKKGSSGYWRNQLSEENIVKADKIAGPLLRYLGYPSAQEEMKISRDFPHENFEELKQQLIASQKFLYADLPHPQLSSNRF